MTTGQAVDLSDLNLARLSQIPGSSSFKTNEVLLLTLDNNRLPSLNGIEKYNNLVQLSVCCNRLVCVKGLSHLPDLALANFQDNSLTDVTGIETLRKLQWLSLHGNSIKECSSLRGNKMLTYLDLSGNCITSLPPLSSLSNLVTLLLHDNAIHSLATIGGTLPTGLKKLTLGNNSVTDLNQFAYLSELPNMEETVVAGNPCLVWKENVVDYRIFIYYWCKTIKMLDDIELSDYERIAAQYLFPESACYPFKLGQHSKLVKYLNQVMPHLQKMFQGIPELDDPSSLQPHKKWPEGSFQGDSDHSLSTTPLDATPLSGNSSCREDGQVTADELDSPENTVSQTTNPVESVLIDCTLEVNNCMDDVKVTKPHSKKMVSNLHTRPRTKLKILKHLNNVITEHRKKVGIETLLTVGEDSSLLECDSDSTNSASLDDETSDTTEGIDESILQASASKIQAFWRRWLMKQNFNNFLKKRRAAKTIQSAWRSYKARKTDPDVINTQNIIRQRKAEQYILHLLQQVKGCQQELAHCTQVIQLQEETIHCLLGEVESLQKWREKMDPSNRAIPETCLPPDLPLQSDGADENDTVVSSSRSLTLNWDDIPGFSPTTSSPETFKIVKPLASPTQ